MSCPWQSCYRPSSGDHSLCPATIQPSRKYPEKIGQILQFLSVSDLERLTYELPLIKLVMKSIVSSSLITAKDPPCLLQRCSAASQERLSLLKLKQKLPFFFPWPAHRNRASIIDFVEHFWTRKELHLLCKRCFVKCATAALLEIDSAWALRRFSCSWIRASSRLFHSSSFWSHLLEKRKKFGALNRDVFEELWIL